mgnify:CR=1 FL=1
MNNKTLLLLLVLTFVTIYLVNTTYEGYSNENEYQRLYKFFQEDINLKNPKNLPVQRYSGDPRYLYPMNYNKFCEARGLKSANPPEICCTRKKCDYNANCKCKHQITGECLICFPNISIAP